MKFRYFLFVIPFLFISCASLNFEDKASSYEIITINNVTELADINAEYPQFTAKEYSKLNRDIEIYVQEEMSGFSDNVKLDFEEYGMSVFALDNKSDFELKIEEIIQNKDITSVLLSVWYYEQGAAHGQYFLKSFNYNSSTQSFLQITDVSKLSLREIAWESRRQLYKEKNADDYMIEYGTTPIIENFSTFTVDGNKITIYFDPYSVGPWATGVHEVHLENN